MPATSRLAIACLAAVGLLSACGTMVTGKPTPASVPPTTTTTVGTATRVASTTPDNGPSAPATPPTVPPAAGLPAPPNAGHIATSTAHTDGRFVALTFDDGPDPAWTPQVLALLARYHVRATFCLIGSQVRQHPDLVRAIVAGGHALCDHTMTHDEGLPKRPASDMEEEIVGDRQAILDAAPDASVMYFRAPAGNFSRPGASPSEQDIAVQWGMQPLGWSVDTRDWTRPGAPAIVATIQRHVHGHDVILMHDGGGNRSQTVAALGQVLPWLTSQGYQFDIPE